MWERGKKKRGFSRLRRIVSLSLSLIFFLSRSRRLNGLRNDSNVRVVSPIAFYLVDIAQPQQFYISNFKASFVRPSSASEVLSFSLSLCLIVSGGLRWKYK